MSIWNFRAPFDSVFSTGKFIRIALSKFMFWRRCSKRKLKKGEKPVYDEQEREELFFRNGMMKFYYELDVVNLLKSVRLSKMLTQSQLTPH